MPCKGCQSSTPGKTRCVVCQGKWCNDCLNTGAQLRPSGWKCNECVGTPSHSYSSRNTLTDTGHPDHYWHQKIKDCGYHIDDSNKDDYNFRRLVEDFQR